MDGHPTSWSWVLRPPLPFLFVITDKFLDFVITLNLPNFEIVNFLTTASHVLGSLIPLCLLSDIMKISSFLPLPFLPTYVPPACTIAFLPAQDSWIHHMKCLSVTSSLVLLLSSFFTHSFICLFIQYIVIEHLICSGTVLGSRETMVSKIDTNSLPESQNLIHSNSLLDLMFGILNVPKNVWFPTFSGPSLLPEFLLYAFYIPSPIPQGPSQTLTHF